MQKFSTSAQWLSFVSIQDPNALKKATSSVISLPDLYAQFLELLCYICVEESGLYNMMIDLQIKDEDRSFKSIEEIYRLYLTSLMEQ